MSKTVVALLLVLALPPSRTFAQTPATDAEEARSRLSSLRSGARVTVLTKEGQVLEGSVIESPRNSLRLRPKGTVFPAETAVTFGDITSVTRGWQSEPARSDSPWNGVAIGAGIGLGVGLVGMNSLGEYNSDGVGPLLVMTTGIGAGLGAVVDKVLSGGKGGGIVYQSPDSGRSISLSPVVSKRQRALVLSMRF